jgi:DNA-binding response OmpR family regulator
MRVLVISDRAAHGDGLAEYLRTRGLECHWTVCLMGAKALSSLKPFDAVVSELILECLQPSALQIRQYCTSPSTQRLSTGCYRVPVPR